jgi:transketolase
VGLARADLELGHSRTIFVLMGDGEMMEGSVWESLLLAPSLGIVNIVALIDHNKSIARGSIPINHPNMLPLAAKISAFGWEVAEADGHSHAEISRAINGRSRRQPFALVAHTVKGKGVSYMENKPIWAYRSPNKDEFALAMRELADA